jgi:DNA processing protein
VNATQPPSASSCPDAVLPRDSARYPGELLSLGEDAPDKLFARGNPDLLDVQPRVAIVGTRRATPYGIRVTRELTTVLVRAGACIVSGMASGIDGVAHRTALDLDGTTIAVLGTGLDQVYPRSHRILQQQIAARGLLLTELEAHEHGMPFTFIHRNRIIAALAKLVIVVEAPEQSGALSTAECAERIGRVVGAVPGPIDQPQSVGANTLLLHNAQPILSAAHALALVGLSPPARVPRSGPDGPEGKVWSALSRGAMDMDSLATATGLPAAECLAVVTRLELAGSVECELTGAIRRR